MKTQKKNRVKSIGSNGTSVLLSKYLCLHSNPNINVAIPLTIKTNIKNKILFLSITDFLLAKQHFWECIFVHLLYLYIRYN